mmetsp:Transcript_22349/g.37872  ORF Transcript_22349/g.37872 Transcript_22349/m.37872 type:complete len:219 (-) Transcript_22349:1171-1827(-)
MAVKALMTRTTLGSRSSCWMYCFIKDVFIPTTRSHAETLKILRVMMAFSMATSFLLMSELANAVSLNDSTFFALGIGNALVLGSRRRRVISLKADRDSLILSKCRCGLTPKCLEDGDSSDPIEGFCGFLSRAFETLAGEPCGASSQKESIFGVGLVDILSSEASCTTFLWSPFPPLFPPTAPMTSMASCAREPSCGTLLSFWNAPLPSFATFFHRCIC